jgi:hypothetical protein
MSIGVSLGIGTMTAAALGNILADVVGLNLGGLIEEAAHRMGVPDPGLSVEQRAMGVTRAVTVRGCAGLCGGEVGGLGWRGLMGYVGVLGRWWCLSGVRGLLVLILRRLLFSSDPVLTYFLLFALYICHILTQWPKRTPTNSTRAAAGASRWAASWECCPCSSSRTPPRRSTPPR